MDNVNPTSPSSVQRRITADPTHVTDLSLNTIIKKKRTWSDVLQVLSFSGFCDAFETRKQMHPVGLERALDGPSKRTFQLPIAVFMTIATQTTKTKTPLVRLLKPGVSRFTDQAN
jgi:hypothetical protein